MDEWAGRVVATVGIVVAFVGIWLDAIESRGFGQSYWQIDRTLGAYLLVLACLCALLVLNTAAGWRGLDLALGGAGAVLVGTYLFFPATLAFDQLEFVGAGAWLGVCAALIPLGAGAAYLLSNQARLRADVAREEAVGRLITLVGLALVLAGVWLPVDTSNDGTYWNVTGAGHSLGILFLILIGICALSVLAASRTRRRAANLLAAGAALVLFGLVLFVPVSSAFNQLDSLRAGAWLSLAGGAVLAVGTVMAWTSPARGPFEGP